MKGEKELFEKLPIILGFGKLDDRKVKVEYPEGTEKIPMIKVVYRDCKGDPVYRVEMTEDSCRIEELFENQTIGQSSGKTLEKAFGTLMMNFEGNPRFRELAGKIKGGRRVIIHDPGEEGTKTIFFPAGFVFFLRFPVIGQDRLRKIEGLKASPWHSPRFESLEQGTVLILNEENELSYRSVPVAEFNCTLWDLEESVKRIFAEGMIPENESGAICLQVLTVADQEPGSFAINYWFEGDRIFFFSLLLKREGDIPSETAIDFLKQHLRKFEELRTGQQNGT
jgi:hypothetical protein